MVQMLLLSGTPQLMLWRQHWLMLYVTEAGFKNLAGIDIKVWSFLFNIFLLLNMAVDKKPDWLWFCSDNSRRAKRW